jgi:hypothetical protein
VSLLIITNHQANQVVYESAHTVYFVIVEDIPYGAYPFYTPPASEKRVSSKKGKAILVTRSRKPRIRP